MRTGTRFREMALLAVLFVATCVFWNSSVLYPVKAFVVLLHELSHGLAAVLTGGHIERIELTSDLGGVSWSRGGWRLLVLPAGYLGSMLLGGLILVLSARTHHSRLLAGMLGILVIGVTAALVRSLFGVAFGVLFGLTLLLASRYLPQAINEIMLRFLGLVSILYAAIDIKDDLISRSVPGSDAYAMSQELFFPPVFWGVLWMGLAVAAAVVFLYVASHGRTQADRPRAAPPI